MTICNLKYYFTDLFKLEVNSKEIVFGLHRMSGREKSKGLAALLGALGTMGLLAIGRGSGMPAIMFYCWVSFGGTAWWVEWHPLVMELLCSGVLLGWIAMLGCGVFLV